MDVEGLLQQQPSSFVEIQLSAAKPNRATYYCVAKLGNLLTPDESAKLVGSNIQEVSIFFNTRLPVGSLSSNGQKLGVTVGGERRPDGGILAVGPRCSKGGGKVMEPD